MLGFLLWAVAQLKKRKGGVAKYSKRDVNHAEK